MGDPLDLSDSEDYGGHDDHHGDYSQRMEELFDDADDDSKDDGDDELTDEEEGFLYTGMDAEDSSVGYRQQLRDVLEQNEDEEYKLNADEVERSLALDSDARASVDDEEKLLVSSLHTFNEV
jgi:hypothetical protein